MLVAAVAISLCAAVPRAEGARVRAFAVGPKLELSSWLDSREHFRGKVRALFDRSLRGAPGTPAVEPGADDVASHLLGPADPAQPVETARDFVAFPESLGLFAGLGGGKGALSRSAPDVTTAIASLLATYAPEMAYYAARHPQLLGRVPQTRLLALALTDRFGRTVVETFAELADRYDVWLEVGVDMARDWRIVCEDDGRFNRELPVPGGARCEREDPLAVARLRVPEEPRREYAYEAISAEPVVMSLYFDPDGRLAAKHVKAYLTPVELNGQLDLVPGRASGLGALVTPVGTIGTVTSKDAWMPDVQAKLDARGVDLLVQPEFFVGDTIRRGVPWAPDTLHASGYNAVLRRPAFEAMVLPEMTGNAYELTADAQSHIVRRPRRRLGRPALRPALLGQPAQAGFDRVARWTVDDPVGLSLAERRQRLAEAGEADPGGVEDVIWSEVEVDRRPAYRRDRRRRARTRFGANRPIGPSRSRQRNVDLAAAGRTVLAAYEQGGARSAAVRVRLSRNGGRSFSRRAAVLRAGAGRASWSPSVALSRLDAAVAWVDGGADGRGEPARLSVAVSRNAGRSFAAPRRVLGPGGANAAQWHPSLAAASGGGFHLVWVEESESSSDDSLPQAHAFHARLGPDGSLDGAPRRLDGGAPVPLASKLDNSWAPDVAARGTRVTAAWVDFRTYDWRPYARTSLDGGRTWGAERAVSEAAPMDSQGVGEQLADSPSVALTPRRAVVAWTDWRKRPDQLVPNPAYDTWVAAGSAAGAGFTEFRGDSLGVRQASSFWPRIVTFGNDLLLVWQDSRSGDGDIRVTRIAGGVRRGHTHRVDDTGRTGINQYRPAIARSGARVLVAWEDERDGPSQIYLASASRRALR